MGEGGRRPDEGEATSTDDAPPPPGFEGAIFVPAEDPRPKQARLRGFARDLRRQATPHERRLWACLRDRRFAEFKFRRQVPIGPFIVDFVCYEARLIIELDGSQHADDQVYDSRRDAELERRGFRILRFWNGDLIVNRDSVLDTIAITLEAGTAQAASPSSALRAPSPIKGEGAD
jgi:very-short-patch-repair endonuclease